MGEESATASVPLGLLYDSCFTFDNDLFDFSLSEKDFG